SALGTRCQLWSAALSHSPGLLRCCAHCMACLFISARLCLAASWEDTSCGDQRSVHRRDVLPRNRFGHLTPYWSKAAIGCSRVGTLRSSAFPEGIGTRTRNRDMDLRLWIHCGRLRWVQ